MEARKIIKFGNTSFVTTIPNEWIKENKLEKGDSIILRKSLNQLVYSVKEEEKKKIVELSIDKNPLKIFNKKLFSYYLKNYEEIKITSKNIVDKLDQIKQFKEKLCSMEIYEIGKDYVILKDTSKVSENSVTDLTERISGVLTLMFEEILNENRRTILTQLDGNVNKLSFLTFKTINYALENFLNDFDNKDSVYYWRIISSLESIGDILKDISRHISRGSETDIKATKLLLQDVLNYFNLIKQIINKEANIEKNIQVHIDKKQSLKREFENKKSEFDKNNQNFYYLIIQSFKNILENIDTIVLSGIDIYLK